MYYGGQNFYNYSPRPMSEKAKRYHENMRKREEARKLAAQRKRDDYIVLGDNAELIEKLIAASLTERNYGFLTKMVESFNQYGSLTEKQEAAVRKVLADREQRAMQRVAENAALAAVSNHVGVVGERSEFVLSIDRAFGFEGKFGYTYGHVMHDKDGNVFAYFGNQLGDAGQAVRGKATIKRHDQRDGVKQTVLSRPKFDLIDYSADDHSTDDIVDDIQAAGAQ